MNKKADNKTKKNTDKVDAHIRINRAVYEYGKRKAKELGIPLNLYLTYLISSSGKITKKYSDEQAQIIHRDVVSLHRTINQYNVQINKSLRGAGVNLGVPYSELRKIVDSIKDLTDKVNNLADKLDEKKIKPLPVTNKKKKQNIKENKSEKDASNMFYGSDEWKKIEKKIEKNSMFHRVED